MIVDLFAGPGGWDEGLRLIGRTDVVGIELDEDACRTAAAAGHWRIQADVSKYPPAAFGYVEGLIASPPCTAFSLAGKGAGRDALDLLLAAIRDRDWPALREYDPSVWLALEVGRWVEALVPSWIVCEQVPQALPLWETYVHVLNDMGYAADARVLMAADFGVPQTRQRAFLLARCDGQPIRWPEPTHFGDRRRRGQPDLFDSPWVTAADALGWSGEIDRRTNSKDGRGGMVPTVTVPCDNPAPTITGKAASQWKVYPEWMGQRPAPTIIGTRQIAAPGHRCMSDDCCGRGRTAHFDEDAISVTVSELGVLQSFPADYPWYGTQTSQGQQVGNAVPPVLAAHVLGALTGAQEMAHA